MNSNRLIFEWKKLTVKERIITAIVLFFLVALFVGLAIVSWIIGVVAVLIVAGLSLLILAGVMATAAWKMFVMRIRRRKAIRERW